LLSPFGHRPFARCSARRCQDLASEDDDQEERGGHITGSRRRQWVANASPSHGWSKHRSSILAGAFVLSAAAVAWYGFGNGGHTAPAGPQLTMAGAPAATADDAAPGPLSLGGLPTRLVAAAASIDAPNAEVGIVGTGNGPAWETAWHSVGHNLDSALPGQPGNVVLTGHVSVADPANAAYFARLDKLVPGDVVDLYSGDTVFHYRVTKLTVVPPTAVNVVRSDGGSTLTLITCTHDLKNRLVVTGTLT
jgi:LPXTG-site transpeptidase (sortase) family protein